MFPLLLILLRKQPVRIVIMILIAIIVASLAMAEWSVRRGWDGVFFLPHLRAWELLIGSLCAYRLREKGPSRNDFAALVGFLMIAYAVFRFDGNTPFPSAWGLFPVLGTALIILFATGDSWLGRALSLRPVVLLGLISYSAYLWHQPIFAFARAYSRDRPSPLTLSLMAPVALLLAYLSWRYIEAPFRDRRRVSIKTIIWIFAPLSILFIVSGLALHFSKGAPSRLPQAMMEGDKSSIYNPTAFRFRVDAFTTDKPVKLLILGDSFGRDVANMVVETFGEKKIEIVYRDDVICPAKYPLAAQSDAVFISYPPTECLQDTLDWSAKEGKPLFYFGSKNFGTNINWIMRESKRDLLYTDPDPKYMALNRSMEREVTPEHYIPVMERLMKNGRMPFTDAAGNLLSDDTMHLTRAGAIYVGKIVLSDPRLQAILDP